MCVVDSETRRLAAQLFKVGVSKIYFWERLELVRTSPANPVYWTDLQNNLYSMLLAGKKNEPNRSRKIDWPGIYFSDQIWKLEPKYPILPLRANIFLSIHKNTRQLAVGGTVGNKMGWFKDWYLLQTTCVLVCIFAIFISSQKKGKWQNTIYKRASLMR